MHDPAIMKYNHIAFDPAMCIDVLGSPDAFLQTVDDFADFGYVVDDGCATSGWVAGCEFEDAAAVDLQEGAVGVQGVTPDHLCVESVWAWNESV